MAASGAASLAPAGALARSTRPAGVEAEVDIGELDDDALEVAGAAPPLSGVAGQRTGSPPAPRSQAGCVHGDLQRLVAGCAQLAGRP